MPLLDEENRRNAAAEDNCDIKGLIEIVLLVSEEGATAPPISVVPK